MIKNSAQKYYSFVTLFIFFSLLFFFIKSQPISNEIKYVRIGGVDVKVELAKDRPSQEKGLSGRENLLPNTGMLFVFPKLDEYYFWMKGMNFPIDMIWINELNEIIYIKKDAQPENFLETYGPDKKSLYVLEVSAGFSDQHNLQEGDKVEFIK